MSEYPARANFFDASALIKVFTNEYGSERVTEYFNNQAPTKFTTPFCLYETLNILKSKWVYREELSKEQYLECCFKLLSWYRLANEHVADLELFDPVVLDKVQSLVGLYSLDVSDALQLLTVKAGDFSFFVEESETLFVTADKGLALAAKKENIKTWCCIDGEPPK
ncbi:type II toxin-antitoxin system VapC family toxin [Saccharophagus degradans]|uniref:type II toxin-antitoxin system VapC family toxin n=1 Tax=Saccharophagus degradans TaxID=86304 RepID=UPI001C08FB93|nr:type II toxin-antitoxin system VapC family toxin [Saccharophagus degradans]MBU2984032.1 type II toxin-antitoxin system VapC family toxin [Saccharophagus degradans]